MTTLAYLRHNHDDDQRQGYGNSDRAQICEVSEDWER